MPPNTFQSLRFIRKTENFHPVIVQRIRLGQVDDIKPYWQRSASVAHSEEEPLSVPVSIYVVLENQVVLVIGNFDGCQ